jgi:hypothetical protein
MIGCTTFYDDYYDLAELQSLLGTPTVGEARGVVISTSSGEPGHTTAFAVPSGRRDWMCGCAAEPTGDFSNGVHAYRVRPCAVHTDALPKGRVAVCALLGELAKLDDDTVSACVRADAEDSHALLEMTITIDFRRVERVFHQPLQDAGSASLADLLRSGNAAEARRMLWSYVNDEGGRSQS